MRQSAMLGAETTLGREAGNAVLLNDQTVGRRHAVIRQSGAGYMIEDLGSTNGTFVNEQRIAGAAPLKPGDLIRLGGQILRYEETQVAPPLKIEVSRGEAPPIPGTRPVENPGLFKNASPASNLGCLDINLEGCLRWFLIAIIVLFILTVIALVLGGLSGGLGGLAGVGGAAGAGGAGGMGESGEPAAGGDEAPPPPPEDDGPASSKRGGPVRIVDVKVDFGRRSGYTGVVPIVLVTWQNVGKNPLTQVRATVTGYDANGRSVGTIENATMYSGTAIQPGEQHQDTVQQGGIVAVPATGNKLRQAPKRAAVDVLDAR